MNAPLQQNQASALSFDGRPELREQIHEWLGSAAHYASLAQGHAEKADDCGLEYDLRRVIAYVRAARDVYNNLVKASISGEGE